MNYIEVRLKCNPTNEAIHEALCAVLADHGYNSFVENEEGSLAYIAEADFSLETLHHAIENFPLDIDIEVSHACIEAKNWNEEWEKNYFSPIVLDNKCTIKSSFHTHVPTSEYNIIINPKMAFGTGHHQTTVLMLHEILKNDFRDKVVLDMGCGTAVLAILASMRGAKELTAIDIDEWAYDNAIENIEINNIDNIEVLTGDADLLGTKEYDVILANINRNILLQDIKAYSHALNEDGELYISGFYVDDMEVLKAEAEKNHLEMKHFSEKEKWACMKLVKH